MASLIEKYGWHEWLSKSNFSFLVGASHPKELLLEAMQKSYRGMTLDDFDGVYGLARFYRNWKAIKVEMGENNDFKPSYGVEIHIEEDHHLPIALQKTIVLIALNIKGYHELCQIVSFMHEQKKTKSFISLEALSKQAVENLIVLLPMRGILRVGKLQEILNLKELFTKRLYFTLSRMLHPYEDSLIPKVIELSKKTGSEILLSQDIFFHREDQKRFSDVLHAIRCNQTIDQAKPQFFANGERSFHSLAELESRYQGFDFYKKSLISSRDLSDQLDFCMSSLRYHYPREMIPEGFTAQRYLEKIVWERVQERLGDRCNEAIVATIRHELDLIAKLEFADYFLTVWDIVNWARNHDILCQGRGSAANSVVCYVLGITSVDPRDFSVLFERFVSMERNDPPDIDVDFEHERREEVIQYIYSRYGRHRAAMVANVITFRRKGSMRAVGQALDLPQNLVENISSVIRSKMARNLTPAGVIDLASQKTVDEPVSKKKISYLIEFSDRLKGFPRHLGIHSGGFVISASPLSQLVPIEPATMEGRSVIQWCKEDIEGLGFFKIDILALGMLTMVRKSFEAIQTIHHKKITMASIPTDDAPTYDLICKADTVGTFQIESRAQMSMLARLQPRCFYDLVIEVAIVRPGPIQGEIIHPYLRRRQGIDPIDLPTPAVGEILGRTLGVPIFQEQLMRLAIVLGDFTPGEANELRQSIGAWTLKNSDERLNRWVLKLEKGMRDKNLNETFIKQVLGQMSGFAHYGFPESHAVSFALIAYVSCYIKTHFPECFFLAILNSQPMGFYSARSLIEDARRRGISVLAVSVKKSGWDYRLEKQEDGSFALRVGLREVRGLSSRCAKAIADLNSLEVGLGKSVFNSIENFLEAVRPNRSDVASLASSGALSCFGLSRSEALWFAAKVPVCTRLEELDYESIEWEAESGLCRLRRDFSATGISLGDHPAAIVKQEQWNYPVTQKKICMAFDLDIDEKLQNRSVTVFGLMVIQQAPPSAKGLVFITLEDETGLINLALYPDVYARYFHIVSSSIFLCVSGKVQKPVDGKGRVLRGHSLLVNTIYSSHGK